jgi:hypothetical protein
VIDQSWSSGRDSNITPVIKQRWRTDVKPAHLAAEAETVLHTINKPGLFNQPLTAQDLETMDGTLVAIQTRGTTIKTITAPTTPSLISPSTLVLRHQ